jgi:Ca-activated chloride channel family protein
MAIVHLWVGAAIVTAALGFAVAAWWWARGDRRSSDDVPAARLDRVRALPGFRALVRSEWNRRRIEVACLLLALVGIALLASRLVGVSDSAREMRTRDVVLCLDVSDSMKEVDLDIIDTYLALVDTFEEERIGLVMFDAYAVTAFPLTTDRAYIADQLVRAKATIKSGTVPGASAARVGSSLIGDGLMSCTQRFSADESRSRTIVWGTDNLVSGDAIYSVPEAAKHAADANIMVFAIAPKGVPIAAIDELATVLTATRGDVLTLAPGGSTNVATISAAVTAQQKSAILALAQDRSFDVLWPGGLLCVFGLGGSLATCWRRP